MQKLKTSCFFALGVIFFLGCFYLFLNQPAPAKFQSTPVIKVGETIIPLEIADENAERVKGLSGRSSLPSGSGLLFVFEESGLLSFWMKDMLFSIDVVWIDENWEVIGVAEAVSPDSFPQTFSPSRPAQYVLELNSGEALKFGLTPGREVTFQYQN